MAVQTLVFKIRAPRLNFDTYVKVVNKKKSALNNLQSNSGFSFKKKKQKFDRTQLEQYKKSQQFENMVFTEYIKIPKI